MSTKTRIIGAALSVVTTCVLAGCNGSGSSSAGSPSAGGSAAGASATTAAAGGASSAAVTPVAASSTPAGSPATSAAAGGGSAAIPDPCTSVTAAELSHAVGVAYIAVTGSNGFCSVTGPGAASFDYTVQKESPTNTWTQQVATIKGDDGQALSEPGIGDKAVWGGKEFAAEADGYIVGIVGADFPSTAQGSGFTRTTKIAKLLISKL